MASVGIHAGDPEHHGRDLTSLGMDERLREDLRLRVRPGWLYGPVFGDELTRIRGAVDEHRAREDELLDLEA